MSLTILLGDYGTGKTATAKYLAKQTGGVYLDIDVLASNGNLVDNLQDVIHNETEYYLDGWNIHHSSSRLLIPEMAVKYIVCMAAPVVVIKRQAKKAGHVRAALPKSRTEIWNTTHMAACIALTYDDNPLFADTTTRPVTFWRKGDWISRWMEINLYSELKDAREYQDVELPNFTIRGLSRSYKTWERLSQLVDFKGKSVCDYGCNYGYFCFKAEEAGAERVIGVDESSTVIDIATSIGITKYSRVRFAISTLKDYRQGEVDIILALNVLHHLDYDADVLGKMFSSARTVALEMPAKDSAVVDKIAHCHQFPEPAVASSHRDGRCIVVYTKAKPVVVPRKFTYSPRRAAFEKWVRSWARAILGILSMRLLAMR